MKLPSQKKILREDLKDAPAWVGGIIDPVNSFMETVYQALNKNINEDNTSSQMKELTYITPSTYPVMANVQFVSALKSKAVSVVIAQVYEKNTYTPVATSNPAWVEVNGAIVLGPILGLQASKTYIVRLRIT